MSPAATPAAAEAGVTAFLNADFDWVRRLDEVWSDSTTDVPELHADLRTDLQGRLTRLLASPPGQRSQLILPYLGNAGSGKTHLLSFVRREAIARGMQFVLIDMTDVKDFWSTVTLGYLESLSRRVNDGVSQLETVLRKLVAISSMDAHPEQTVTRLAGLPSAGLNQAISRILTGLQLSARVHVHDLVEYHNVVHALFFLNSRDLETCDLAHTWFQRKDLEESDARRLGIRNREKKLSSIVKGLSWVMGLCAPTVLAFDQIDAIVTQQHLVAASPCTVEPNEEQKAALAIIEGIAGGLAAIVDETIRTLPVLTSLPTTLYAVKEKVLTAHGDRFQQHYALKEITTEDVARAVIERRLEEAYRSVGFSPPYPSWPFRPECFRVQGVFPRQILQKCAEHQRRCARENKVIEISALPTADKPAGAISLASNKWSDLDQKLQHAAALPLLLAEEKEDELGNLILRGCELLIKETTVPPDIDLLLDSDFGGRKTFPALHARIRTVYHSESDREEHACVRVLQRTHPAAYKARLCAAMTAAGIDRDLPFRKLVIVRTAPRLTGLKMAELTSQFEKRGGLLVGISEADAGKLKVLVDLWQARDPELDSWLRDRKPVSRLAFFGQLLAQHGEESDKKVTPAEKQPAHIPSPGPSPVTLPQQPQSGADGALLIGRRLISGKPDTPVNLPAKVLSRHTVIRAGSGGGKTVLLKRLVEEAAISGIPSILIDVANDLAQIGDPWSTDPEYWIPGDSERARRYHRETEVVIWTPGRTAGRPLQLETLPDFAAIAEDDDQLNSAVDMALGTLEQYVAPGASGIARKKKGVLAAALRHFGRHGGGDMDALIAFLADLPVEAGGGITDSQKIARSIADDLRAMVQTEPLLQTSADTVDPGLLFGVGRKRTRVSVISLIGLGTPSAQQNFVNQLAMALFSWIKKHPSAGPHGLTGLFAIDEAKDFLPAVSTAPCKKSLMILAAQARKYGLGLVFATQNPKDIDYKAVAQFSTQFFGKANAPQVIEQIQKSLAEKGGGGDDIGRLQRGQFYLVTEGIAEPLRISVPMCLSCHPEGRPLTEAEILTKARRD